jgi:hypothetical protein
MHVIILSWVESLKFIFSTDFLRALRYAAQQWLRTIVLLARTFPWFFVVDLILFWLAGEKIIELIQTTLRGQPSGHPVTALFYLATGVIWFVLYSASLLFIRRQDDEAAPRAYLREYFFRMIQLLFFCGIISFTFIIVLMLSGITMIPSIHWSFVFLFRLIELIALFYWLDSTTFSFKDLVQSLEKSINFIFYNLPVMLVIFGSLWCSEVLVKALLWGWSQEFMQDYLLLAGKIDAIVKYHDVVSVPTFLLFKYAKFFIELFWISLIVVLYEAKKHLAYTQSFFDQMPDNSKDL